MSWGVGGENTANLNLARTVQGGRGSVSAEVREAKRGIVAVVRLSFLRGRSWYMVHGAGTRLSMREEQD